jgi:hypothetical protein
MQDVSMETLTVIQAMLQRETIALKMKESNK